MQWFSLLTAGGVDVRWCSFLHQWTVTKGAALGLHSAVGAGFGWEALPMMDTSTLCPTSWTECSGQSGSD